MSDTVWDQLHHRGFQVVRGFLQPAQVEALVQDFQQGQPPERYPFGFKPVGRRALQAVASTIEAALEQIRAQTDLQTDSVNFLTLSHYVASWLAERPSTLHQDFDLDFRLTGDHRHYLNFWMPIVKPCAEQTNVAVLPMDSLQARSPEAYQRVLGGGGQRWVPHDGRTAAYGDRGAILEGETPLPLFWLDFDLEELLETPHLEAGDLLLLRGDVIHRTQDQATRRVAASIRATASHKVLHKDRAVYQKGDAAEPVLHMLERCFQSQGREQVTIAEFLEFAQGR